MRERQTAIDEHRRRDNAAAFVIEGVPHCCDCLGEIEARRLAACPNAARCIECQTYYEQEQDRQRRTGCRK
ncbi:MAG: TraR/DksA family transcriptional regulator [Pseudomonadota bacterium]|nr:TraR/DksA family transcriptional regulator [Pseudomonadota bacterium]